MDKLTVMDFSGIYEKEPWMCEWKSRWLSFRSLEGTDGYCTDEGAYQIRRHIAKREEQGIHFLDSGNYHYVSKFWLEKIQAPFDLIVFDRHSDMQPSALLPLTSCGNWLLEVLEEQKYLRNVWLIGPPEETLNEIPESCRKRIHAIEEKAASRGEMEEIDGPERNVPVYLSIDKDVLRQEDAPTNWDQGSMELEMLLQWLCHIGGTRRVIGADICGEYSVNGVYEKVEEACRKNDQTNQTLARYLKRILVKM